MIHTSFNRHLIIRKSLHHNIIRFCLCIVFVTLIQDNTYNPLLVSLSSPDTSIFFHRSLFYVVITRLNIWISAGTVKSLFGPFVELVKSFNLPDWLVHWGHPGNMVNCPFSLLSTTLLLSKDNKCTKTCYRVHRTLNEVEATRPTPSQCSMIFLCWVSASRHDY